MRKRQRKKNLKKKAIEFYARTGIDVLHCENCGAKLYPWAVDYHRKWGTCDSYCYGVLVGVYY